MSCARECYIATYYVRSLYTLHSFVIDFCVNFDARPVPAWLELCARPRSPWPTTRIYAPRL